MRVHGRTVLRLSLLLVVGTLLLPACASQDAAGPRPSTPSARAADANNCDGAPMSSRYAGRMRQDGVGDAFSGFQQNCYEPAASDLKH